MFKILLSVVFGMFFSAQDVFARAGGGGSSSGGGGGGSGSGGGSTVGSFIGSAVFFGIIIIVTIIGAYKRKKSIEKTRLVLTASKRSDPSWDEASIKRRVEYVFYQFQKSWSELDVVPMQEFLTDAYYKRMVLEMNVLRNMHRKNLMQGVKLTSVEILQVEDSADNSLDNFIAEIRARAKDVLWDEAANKELYHDSADFVEYWHFHRVGDDWKLNLISQATAELSLFEKSIEEFAKKNNFYYDPDFGWLMLPKKGVLFSRATFLHSDVNNHVIGYYRDKIVQFYTYTPRAENVYGNHFLVAQAILPISHKDILVKRKKLFNWPKRGLRRMSLESIEFNNKFCLWAHPEDQSRPLELLTPNFMEKIYGLPFELNIEVVDNVVYFFTKNRGADNYQQMLEVLSWAFDEMKM